MELREYIKEIFASDPQLKLMSKPLTDMVNRLKRERNEKEVSGPTISSMLTMMHRAHELARTKVDGIRFEYYLPATAEKAETVAREPELPIPEVRPAVEEEQQVAPSPESVVEKTDDRKVTIPAHVLERLSTPMQRPVLKEPPSLNKIVSDVAESLSLKITDMLAVSLKGWLSVHLGEMVKETLPAILDELKGDGVVQQPPKAPEAKVQKNRLPRIAVVGLKPNQCGIIQSEFCDTFDITFWNDSTGSGVDQLRALGKNCEAVFLHTNHGNHGTVYSLESVKANIINVPGGMNSMRDALTQYYCQK